MSEVDAEIEELLTFFKYDHLPEELQKVSKPFGEMALKAMDLTNHRAVTRSFQRRDMLKSLLAAKDCAVRAAL